MTADSATKKIDSEQKETQELGHEKNTPLEKASAEDSLIFSVQYVLKYHGIERSVSSIRDISDFSEGKFDFKNAISTLTNLDFTANLGRLAAKKITIRSLIMTKNLISIV